MIAQRECKVRLLDEVYVVLVGLKDEHITYFYDRFAIHAPGYIFQPKYKLGQWDGKVRYFQKTGRTYLYLLDEILPQLKRFGYKLTLEDLRVVPPATPSHVTTQEFAHVTHMVWKKPIILREDQVEAVNKLLDAGNGICLAGTGAGKTLMTAALVSAYDKIGVKSLTIVPDQGLIRQTKAEFINCQLDTGEYSGTEKSLDHKHIVSTWQALKNNPAIVEQFQLVIVDECHGLKGNVLTRIICDHAGKVPYRYGFTGTLPKEASDQMSVVVAVGPVRHTMLARTLIDAGVLADIKIDVFQLEEDLTVQYNEFVEESKAYGNPPTYKQFKESYFGDYAVEKDYLHRNITRTEWIADMIISAQQSNRGNIMCFVDSISFGRRLCELIPGAMFVNGVDVKKASEREKLYDVFNHRDDVVMIATVHIAGTGLNIPRIFQLFLLDIGKSYIRVIQSIGRGLRKAHDKDAIHVVDVCSDLKYSKKHLKLRTNYYDEAQYPYKKRKITYTVSTVSPDEDD